MKEVSVIFKRSFEFQSTSKYLKNSFKCARFLFAMIFLFGQSFINSTDNIIFGQIIFVFNKSNQQYSKNENEMTLE